MFKIKHCSWQILSPWLCMYQIVIFYLRQLKHTLWCQKYRFWISLIGLLDLLSWRSPLVPPRNFGPTPKNALLFPLSRVSIKRFVPFQSAICLSVSLSGESEERGANPPTLKNARVANCMNASFYHQIELFPSFLTIWFPTCPSLACQESSCSKKAAFYTKASFQA